MTRFAIPAVGLFIVLTASVASAQPRAPVTNRPTFSPYLNLLRGGVNPAINYYGIVRPQQQFRQQAQVLEQQIYQNSLAVQSLGVSGLVQQQPNLATTGHPVVFNSYGQYFNNLGSGGAGGGGFAGSPAFTTPQLPGYIGGQTPGVGGLTPSVGGVGGLGAVRNTPYGGMAPGFAPRPAVADPAVGPGTGSGVSPAPTPATPGGAGRPVRN